MKQNQEACSSLGGSQKHLGTITIVADSASKIFYNKIRKVHKKMPETRRRTPQLNVYVLMNI